MLIATDIDEVLADFTTAFCEYHNEKHKTHFQKKDFFTYDFFKVYKITEKEMNNRLADFFETEYIKEIKPIEGAYEGVKKLRENHGVIIITSRPESIQKETNEWIVKNFSGCFSKIYYSYQPHFSCGEFNKYEICDKKGVELFIDDQLKYGLNVSKIGIKTLLFDSPWNQRENLPENLVRVKNWNQIVDEVYK